MSTRKSTYNPEPTPTEGEIILQVEIGRVPWKMGDGPSAIAEAFKIAGEYVGEHAGPGREEVVHFEVFGITFTASSKMAAVEVEDGGATPW